MRWQILCDFDGTISIDDTVDGILDRFATPEWLEIERAKAEGQFGSREARRRETALIDAAQADIEAYMDSVAIDPGFPVFLAETSRLGLPLTIVSDGYDMTINRVFARNGVENLDIVSNKLLFLSRGCAVEFPFSDPDCAVEAGVCKCAAMGRLRNRKSVLIGDGISDFCTAGAADFVFAKGSLVDHCRRENIPHYRFETFADLVPLIGHISGDGSALIALGEQQMVS